VYCPTQHSLLPRVHACPSSPNLKRDLYYIHGHSRPVRRIQIRLKSHRVKPLSGILVPPNFSRKLERIDSPLAQFPKRLRAKVLPQANYATKSREDSAFVTRGMRQ
jgi:hypothetical protein